MQVLCRLSTCLHHHGWQLHSAQLLPAQLLWHCPPWLEGGDDLWNRHGVVNVDGREWPMLVIVVMARCTHD